MGWKANVRSKRVDGWGPLTYCEGMTAIQNECGYASPQTIRAWIKKASDKKRVLSNCGHYLLDVLEMPEQKKKPVKKPVPQVKPRMTFERGLLIASVILNVVLMMG